MDKDKKIRKFSLQHWHIIAIYMMIYDMVTIAASYFLALWIRFDCAYGNIPDAYLKPYLKFVPIYIIICVVIYWFFKLYNSVWRFASYNELIRITEASFVTLVIHYICINNFIYRMPISYFLFGTIIQVVFTVGIRFSYRFVLLVIGRRNEEAKKIVRVMLIGAGKAGQMILRDIKTTKETNEKVYCIIDDNVNKHGRYIDGVPIVGDRTNIIDSCQKYDIDKIYVALPSASFAEKKDILDICKDTGCKLMNLPGMYQLYSGEVTVSAMKEVMVEDLLGREPVSVNMKEIYTQITGKVILVTGGGGSIGSELCRQIAAQAPRLLIIFDIYENSAYDIQLELKKKYPYLNLEVLIGSVRDSRKIFKIFEDYRPQIVYHAAAHKHVPLMEDSPCEAIKNNVIGTYKTAYAAMVHGCERFVLISTDKAVNPTNIMGASKRLCEMVIQAFDAKIKLGEAKEIPQLFTHMLDDERLDEQHQKSLNSKLDTAKTEFVAVRFGNVLGSNGSVIPLFKKQIMAGGPVTITHPDIIRYFMTIPEAVSLVMQAGVYAAGGEIFVLDMGEPVKIDTLARNLIKLSGYKPDIDIKIEYIGLRPGEKLYEEKLMAEEGLKQTKNKLIHIGCPIPFDIDVFLENLEKLMDMAYRNNSEIKSLVEDVVETYHPI